MSNSPNKLDQWKKYLPAGAFGISLLLHLCIFLGISSIIIIQATKPHLPFTAAPETSAGADLPPPPDLPADDTPSPETVTPVEDAVPNPTPANMPNVETIVSSAPSMTPSFSMPAALPPGAGEIKPVNLTPQQTATATSTPRAPQVSSPFGSTSVTKSSGLTGYFYDFKISRKDGKNTDMNIAKWSEIMRKFMYNGSWNPEKDFKDYYRSPSPLGITKFFISVRPSQDAPKAFGVPNKPALWCVLYQGTVIAPEDGTYSFVGFGDDLMSVRVNEKTVLDGGWVTFEKPKTYPNLWSKTYKENGLLRIGKSFTVKAGEKVSIDILIGDLGGSCAFFLFIKKDGVDYEKLKDGTPKLPVFRLDNSPVTAEGDCPPFSTAIAPWQPSQ